jgi:hypothetical protein
MGMKRTVGSVATAVFVLAASVSGCGESSSVYLSNAQENVFLKVPRTWRIFRLTASDKEGRPADLPSSAERTWHLVLDGDPAPDPAHVTEHAPTSPVFDVAVYTLSGSANDLMSTSQARRITYGLRSADPVLNDPGTPPAWEVVAGSYKPLSFPKGVSGSRLAVNVPDPDAPDDNTKWATVDAIAMHDAVSSRVYIVKARCSSQCYLDNRTQINDILESWTVNRT